MSGKLELIVASLALVLTTGGQACGSDYLLYAPEPSQGKKPSGPEEGVLVQSITIEKGDTLYSLSRKYNGRGTYYPQILLFNEIKNPNLIYAGNNLLVPVAPAGGKHAVVPRKAGVAGPATRHGEAPGKSKSAEAGTVKLRKTAAPSKATPPAAEEPKPRARAAAIRPAEAPKKTAGEQTLYEEGIEAYKTGNYRQSLDAFDRFLQRYPDSPLVPDVSLYRADTLLKLSSQ